MDIIESLEQMVFSILRDNVSTIKPAVITKVDYDNCTANAKPLTKTLWRDDIQTELDPVQDVPLLMLSGGNARITVPIKKGDNCYIIYSDRNISNLLDSRGNLPVDCEDRRPFGNYPIGILCGWFTTPNAKEFDKENIVIENGTSQIIIKEDVVEVNGCTITEDGNVITKKGVNLDEFYQEYSQHTHTDSMGGSTSPPIKI